MNDLAKIEEIYHAVLELPIQDREKFIRENCGGDEELRREVESLLSFDELADSFIESPPDDLAASILNSNNSESLIGKTINHYRILSFIGAGGMGEVYLAEDTRLGRKIALKLLPPKLSAHPERKARFEQEARAASALNHPNIITIHGIEQFEELNLIATEFIDGETLRERLSGKSISVEEVLDFAIQICSALEAAHSVGVIHRDIKPANIMIRRDKIVKILDFGLAKLTVANGSGSFDTKDLTAPQRVMGTINYMSPEQALGETLDARTDIFSLGVVIYEMLTGVSPFRGNSEAAIYNAIINRNPSAPSASNCEIPSALDAVVNCAIAKLPDERYQSAKELRRDLENLKQNSASKDFAISPTPKVRRNYSRIFLILFAILFPAMLIFGYFKFFGNQTEVSRPIQNYNFTQITSNINALQPSISPDAKTIVFAGRVHEKWDIFFQRIGGETAINLTKNSQSDNIQPNYSPDGEQIVFRSTREGGGIFLMGATGENVRKVSDFGYYPAWSPNGKEIVFSNGNFTDPTDRAFYPAALWILNIESGEQRKLTDGDAVQPNWSPSGTRIAFWGMNDAGNREIMTISASGGEITYVTDNDEAIDWNPVWSADGKYLYFASNRGGSMNFWSVLTDEKTGKKLAAPEPLTTPSVYSQNLAFSKTGNFLAYVQKVNSSNISRAEFDSKTETIDASLTSITQGSRFDRNPSVSPDGEWIAFDAIKDKQEDLFLIKSDGSGEIRQLTNDPNKDRAPRFSPDGNQVIFYSDRTDRYETYIINTDGSGLRKISSDSKPYAQLAFWSPDGKKILQNLSRGEPRIFDAERPFPEQTPFQIPLKPKSNFWTMAYDWSPDGNKISLLKMSAEKPIVGVTTYSLITRKYEADTNFGESPIWLNDNRRLIFFNQNKIFLLDILTNKTKELLSLAPEENLQGITISPDNRFIYFSLQKQDSNIWLSSVE